MCLFSRRRGHPSAAKSPADDQQHGVRNALRLFVDTSTLISPTRNGHHRMRPIVTTKDLPDAAAAYPKSPVVISVGDATLSQLEHIFRDLCGRSPTFYRAFPIRAARVAAPTLSRERLTRFLEHTQGETVAAPLVRERYRFEDFLQVWSYDYGWDAARPPSREEIRDWSLPISNYFISSSHNTYLVGNQLSSEASVGEYQKVLEKNCRCIEIDVWNPPSKSGRQSRNRSKSPHRHAHNRHFSSSSVATSIHDSLEAVTNLLAAKISHSRASSFSQKSPSVLSRTENTTVPDSESPGAKTNCQESSQAAAAHLRELDNGLNSEEAVEDDEVAVEPEEEELITETATEALEASQGTTDTTVAQISITAPDAEIATPAEVPDDDEAWGDQEPVVMHAHSVWNSDWTLGTHVPFRDVCRAVRHSAFRDNPLPIIVSLEVHTNAVQQRKMVRIMKEEWGDLLLDQPLEGTDPRLRLPTLGELQNKILVKVKKAHSPRWTSAGSNGTAGSQGMSLGASLSVLAAAENGGAASGSEDDASGNNASAAAAKSSRITEELGSLAIYTESRHFNNFNDRDAKSASHIFSLSETTIHNLHVKQHGDLFNHNKTHLMRAYPNATKHVMSTNPDPAACWRRGVQMVALNWQTLDKAMMLNHAMFDGSKGWVLKPQGYRATAAAASAGGSADAPKPLSKADDQCPMATAELTRTLDLCITVLAGQRLPLPSALQKKHKRKAGSGERFAAATGIISGRGHPDFRPVVKCELNVERPEGRCPDTAKASRAPAAQSMTSPLSASTTVLNSQTSSAALSPSSPSAPVKIPEALLKQKTAPGQSDHPDWGVRGETLRFMNVTGIVEALSFVAIGVEDEGSKTAQERVTHAIGRNDALAGWACIRLDRLQTGYRFVSLVDALGNATEGKLLVRIEKLLR